MTRLTLFLLTSLFAVASCRTMATFESPNQLRNLPGTLYLANGRQFAGRLVIQAGNLFGTDVKLYADGESQAMHFTMSEVEGYRIDRGHFLLREKAGAFGLGHNWSFMRQLTPDGSRLHLFEDREKVIESGKGSRTGNRYTSRYYVQLPGEAGRLVHSLESSRFVPAFDEKMSRLLADCTTLAEKIAAKQEGYFFAQVSLNTHRRVDVMLRIIEEYNRCGGGGR